MRARYRSRCEECGGTIEPGDLIKKDEENEIFVHAEECYDAEAAAEARYFDRIERSDEIRGFHDYPPDPPDPYEMGG